MMPTYDEAMKSGATAADFGLPPTDEEVLNVIPESEIELADNVARAVQADIDDKNDARDAHIIADGIIEDAELAGCFLLTDERDAMLDSFVQAIAEDHLSIGEASDNLNAALLRHFERQGEEYE